MEEPIGILEQQAVEAAIENHWREAVSLNLKIIKKDKSNIDAYLRLAFAYLQLKNIKEAERYYKKALKLQPGNQTAIENLERIKILSKEKNKNIKSAKKGKSIALNPSLFIDLPGRTKTITLVNPGQKNILAKLTVGQEVFLRQKRRRLEVRNEEKEYIGTLPDDLSRRLSILTKAGSEFKAYIKEATLKKVVVFLQEVKRGKKVLKYFPFPTNIQSKLELSPQEEEKEEADEENEELTDADLEQLAEDLEIKEKEDYLPFTPDELEETEEE